MPQTKFQGIVFSAVMSVLMAYGMELYNVAHKMGGMSNSVFFPAFIEMSYMCIFVFAISNICGNRIGRTIAFRHVSPGKDNPFFITLMVSGCTVAFMCPAMSFVATILFTGISNQFLADWFATICKNFPMAILWQLFFAGPLTRLLFRTIFSQQLNPVQAHDYNANKTTDVESTLNLTSEQTEP